MQAAGSGTLVGRLQVLVGLEVHHRLWGAGRVAAVRGTTAAAFPGGIVVTVDFAMRAGPGTPFTVADLWDGERFARPTLPPQLPEAARLLDALLASSSPAPRLSVGAGRATPPGRGGASSTAGPAPSDGMARPPRPGTAGPASGRPSASATTWARDFLRRDDWVLLDTETTGLDGGAEIIDRALLDRQGAVLLDTLLRPQRPIPPVVSRVHGLDDRHVRAAPTFPAIWPTLRALLAGRTLVAYNVAFDARLLRQTAARHGIALTLPAHECAMRRYAAYRAATNPGGGRASKSLEHACRAHGIPVGGHRAAADCRATLALLRIMAGR